MKNWTDSPFRRTVHRSVVDGYGPSDVVAEDNGESSVIYRAPGNPDWLVKLYKPGANVRHTALDDLIELPGQMLPDDRALVDRSVAWPVARVVDGYRTVGAIMARADEKFSWDVALLQGRTRRQVIEVDLLANPRERIERLGLPVPGAPLRLAAMREVVAVAALFERHDLVYGDWSFSNAFWAPGTSNVLVIDMDTARLGRRARVETPTWEDPLAKNAKTITTHSDRYKVALLVARAATGLRKERREAVEEMARLYPSYPGLVDLLRKCITAPTPAARPKLGELLAAMDRRPAGARPDAPPAGANVTRTVPWNPGGRRRATGATPRPNPLPPKPAPKPTARPAPKPAPRSAPRPTPKPNPATAPPTTRPAGRRLDQRDGRARSGSLPCSCWPSWSCS
ncbi:hypothetical protein BJF79_21980 [Actinomadura sp. CNU-125]|uniref:hypothetical protein n=1 Tax=Actinomadura sp. CNU-125 TaxID=1904961 RepID=UPI000964F175|nr:hypothetical protein [Actinomadura sp. CNU-125]OLT12598.1 hypothetical protein BJF79_21980 [Actinomadura sp. CNU-125]